MAKAKKDYNKQMKVVHLSDQEVGERMDRLVWVDGEIDRLKEQKKKETASFNEDIKKFEKERRQLLLEIRTRDAEVPDDSQMNMFAAGGRGRPVAQNSSSSSCLCQWYSPSTTPSRTTESFTRHSVWLYHRSVQAAASAGTSINSRAE